MESLTIPSSALTRQLSLNAKICIAATALVILSLVITSSVIGVRSSATAEESTMNLVRTAARQAAGALQGRISANLARVTTLAAAMVNTRKAQMPLQREQISEKPGPRFHILEGLREDRAGFHPEFCRAWRDQPRIKKLRREGC